MQESQSYRNVKFRGSLHPFKACCVGTMRGAPSFFIESRALSSAAGTPHSRCCVKTSAQKEEPLQPAIGQGTVDLLALLRFHPDIDFRRCKPTILMHSLSV